MKKGLLICAVILCSFSSKAWIDSVYWNKGVSPHTIRTIGQFDQGTHIKYIDQYFLNGSDTLMIDLVFRDCSGPASSYQWDSTSIISSSTAKPYYCIIVRGILDSNSIPNNCFIHDRYMDTPFADCNAPLSISDINSNISSLQINPNPVKDWIKISLQNQKNAEIICIYDIYGTLIRKEKFRSEVDVSFLSKGIYLIGIQTDEGLIWCKFLKE